MSCSRYRFTLSRKNCIFDPSVYSCTACSNRGKSNIPNLSFLKLGSPSMQYSRNISTLQSSFSTLQKCLRIFLPRSLDASVASARTSLPCSQVLNAPDIDGVFPVRSGAAHKSAGPPILHAKLTPPIDPLCCRIWSRSCKMGSSIPVIGYVQPDTG